MPERKPELRLVVDNDASDIRMLDVFLRLRAVEADPDGEHIMLSLTPRDETVHQAKCPLRPPR